jgi:hypothetical protein
MKNKYYVILLELSDRICFWNGLELSGFTCDWFMDPTDKNLKTKTYIENRKSAFRFKSLTETKRAIEAIRFLCNLEYTNELEKYTIIKIKKK